MSICGNSLESKHHSGGSSKAVLGAYDKAEGRRKIKKSSLQQISLNAPTYNGNDTEIDSAAKSVGKGSIGIGKTVEREEFRLVIDVRYAK